MGELIKLPENQSLSFRSRLIDALLDVRLALLVKQISSKFILKSEFISILDSTKQDAKDQRVSDAIDDLFKEYLIVKDKNIASQSSSVVSMDDAQDANDSENYQESKEENGRSYIKTDSHYKTSVDSETNKAA